MRSRRLHRSSLHSHGRRLRFAIAGWSLPVVAWGCAWLRYLEAYAGKCNAHSTDIPERVCSRAEYAADFADPFASVGMSMVTAALFDIAVCVTVVELIRCQRVRGKDAWSLLAGLVSAVSGYVLGSVMADLVVSGFAQVGRERPGMAALSLLLRAAFPIVGLVILFPVALVLAVILWGCFMMMRVLFSKLRPTRPSGLRL